MENRNASSYENNIKPYGNHSPIPFSCIAAYLPLLFWVPLVVNKDDPKYRHCANQGLWVTISSLACAASILSAPIWILGETGLASYLLVQWAILHWGIRLTYVIFALVSLGIVVFAPFVCIKGVIHGISSPMPYRIPIVGRIKLIRN